MNHPDLPLLLLELLAKSALILAGAALIVRACRQASSAHRHLVWFAALATLLVLPTSRLFSPRWAVPVKPAPTVKVKVDRPVAARPAIFEAAPAGVIAAPAPADAWKMPSWRQILIGTWIGGVVLLLAVRGFGSWQLFRLKRTSEPVKDERVLELVDEALREFRVTSRVSVRISLACRVPMTWGAWRPVLMLPAEALEWRGGQLRAALRHEAGHISRHDYLVRWIASVVCALYWPNPLVWFAARQLRVAQEQATDDLVLRTGVSPEEYATQLVETARTVGTHRLFAFHAVAMASSSTLEDRVVAIVDEQRDRSPLSRFAAAVGILAMAFTLAICTTAQVQGADQVPATEKSNGTGETKAPLQIMIESRFIELAPRNGADRDRWRAPSQVLTAAEFQETLRGLNQRKDVDVLSAPRVVTRSNSRAVIEIIREFRYPTAWEKEAGVWKPTEFETKNVGVTLEVTPQIEADSTIDLQLKPSVVEFLGFVDLETNKKVAAPRGALGAALSVPDTKPLEPLGRIKPVFSERKAENKVALKPGSTVVLANIRETAEIKPFEKDAPKRPLVVFVSASIVDPTKEPEKIKPGATAAERAAAIIIPKVDLRDVTVQEALLFLRHEAQEADPEGRGVELVLKPVPNPETKISVNFARIPLAEALRYVTSIGGLEVTAEPEKLIIAAPENAAAAPVTPSFSISPPAGSAAPAEKAADAQTK